MQLRTLQHHRKREFCSNRLDESEDMNAMKGQLESAPAPANILPDRKHFAELDSLRGLAAIVVVFYHWYHLYPQNIAPGIGERILELTPLQLLISGHSSVILFYVLSGFVLSLPQVRNSKTEYPAYLVKRICRIYLPYLAALALALIGCFFFHGLNAYDSWFQLTWNAPPSWPLIKQHLLFIGSYDDSAYNTAFWSLVQEMRISIFFPLLCFAVIRLRAIPSLIAAVALTAVSVYLDSGARIADTYSQTISSTGIFILGILLSLYLPKLQSWLRSLPRIGWWTLLGACLFLYIYTPLAGYHLHLAKPVMNFMLAIGSAGLILFSLSAVQISKALTARAPSFLGRVSYSIYLLHGTVLFASAYFFYGKVSPIIWFVPYVCVTLAGAALLYRFVEVPSIHLGKILASKIQLRRDDSKLLVAMPLTKD